MQMTDPKRYRKIFILTSTIILCAIFIWLIRNYLVAVILAAVFGILLHPAHSYVRRVLRAGPSVSSALVISVFMVAVGIPFFALAGLAATEAITVSKAIGPWLNEHVYRDGAITVEWPSWLPFRSELEEYQALVFEKMGEVASGVAQFLFTSIENATRGTIGAILNIFIFVYSLFFFLKRGTDTVDSALRYLPINEAERDLFISRGSRVTKAILKSILVIGVLQISLYQRYGFIWRMGKQVIKSSNFYSLIRVCYKGLN
ncbi:MAG: AI-2E family transporter [Acidimicrobiales bacterium]|nr:MAG: AI-2E family transporter [Acidimicrobiales bacterium]